MNRKAFAWLLSLMLMVMTAGAAASGLPEGAEALYGTGDFPLPSHTGSNGPTGGMMFRDYNSGFGEENLYFAIFNLTAGPEDDPGFDALPAAARALYIAALFDMEVQNGGLSQFLVNNGAASAGYVAGSLREIGLRPMADLYETFMSDHGIGPAEIDSYFTGSFGEYLALSERYPFDEFDAAYMALWDSLDFNETMLAYANAHPEIFRGHPDRRPRGRARLWS